MRDEDFNHICNYIHQIEPSRKKYFLKLNEAGYQCFLSRSLKYKAIFSNNQISRRLRSTKLNASKRMKSFVLESLIYYS